MSQLSVEPMEDEPEEWTNPRLTGIATQTETPQRLAQRQLAHALRALNERVVSHCGTAEEMQALAAQVDELRIRVEQTAPITPYLDYAMQQTALLAAGEPREDQQTQRDRWTDYFDLSMIIGRTNPLSPPVQLDLHEEKITGVVTCGRQYEGPPGCVHGGYIAAVFDELLGCAQSLSGDHGMTVNLDVTYVSPTPLHTPLELEAWVQSVDGRKIIAEGTMSAHGAETARATGIFVSIDGSKFRNPRDTNTPNSS